MKKDLNKIRLNKYRLLKDLPSFQDIVTKLNLSQMELLTNIFLIEEVINERTNEVDSDYWPEIIRGGDGFLYKSYELSPKGAEKQFLNYFELKDITHINFFAKLADIDYTPEREVLIKALHGYVKNAKKIKKGFFLYGKPGRGKTFILQCLASELAKTQQTVIFVNVSDLSLTLRQHFSSPNFLEIINKLKMVDFLFLDDLGAEIVADWFRDDVLTNVLTSRMDKHMPSFFSSNYDYQQLNRIESRPANKSHVSYEKSSRLLERIKALSGQMFCLEGKSYRY